MGRMGSQHLTKSVEMRILLVIVQAAYCHLRPKHVKGQASFPNMRRKQTRRYLTEIILTYKTHWHLAQFFH